MDALEQGIKQQSEELEELRVMYNDAQIARDTARAELSKLEQSVYEAKRERETQLQEYKKQAEEKKEHAEKVEKRVRTNYTSSSHCVANERPGDFCVMFLVLFHLHKHDEIFDPLCVHIIT